MPRYPQQYLNDLIKKLPLKLKSFLFSEEVSEAIKNLSNKYNLLSQNQIPVLIDLIVEVFVGLLPPDEFLKNLVQELDIPESTAKSISFHVQRFILNPIKEDLEMIYRSEKNFSEKEKSTKKEEQEKQEVNQDKLVQDNYLEPIE
jgi:hypothetical protein